MKKFKRTKAWKLILLIVVIPIYDFFWRNFINFYGKILYLFWNIKKRSYFDLRHDNKLLFKDNELIHDLANEIAYQCDDKLLSYSRNVIREGSKDPFHNKDSKVFLDEKGEKYLNGIFEKLPYELKKKIVSFASSELMITTAAKYLGVFPILTRIFLLHNISIPNKTERGPQLWHKDGFGFKVLELFILITDINELNGPTYLLNKKSKLGVFEKLENAIQNPRKGERNKISLENFDKIYSKDQIINNIGPKSTAFFFDPYSNYHRGGYCKSGERIILRIAYDTIDSTITNSSERFQKDPNNGVNFSLLEDIEKKEFNNIFLRYLFLKRSYLFYKFKIAEKLISFYQFMHHKII